MKKAPAPTDEEIRIVYEKACIGMMHKDIYYYMGRSHNWFYSAINICDAFKDALKSGESKYREDLLVALKEKSIDPEQSATYMALSINRETTRDGSRPNFSKKTRYIIASAEHSYEDKIKAINDDFAEGRINTKTHTTLLNSFQSCAMMPHQAEFDDLKKQIQELKQILGAKNV